MKGINRVEGGGTKAILSAASADRHKISEGSINLLRISGSGQFLSDATIPGNKGVPHERFNSTLARTSEGPRGRRTSTLRPLSFSQSRLSPLFLSFLLLRHSTTYFTPFHLHFLHFPRAINHRTALSFLFSSLPALNRLATMSIPYVQVDINKSVGALLVGTSSSTSLNPLLTHSLPHSIAPQEPGQTVCSSPLNWSRCGNTSLRTETGGACSAVPWSSCCSSIQSVRSVTFLASIVSQLVFVSHATENGK